MYRILVVFLLLVLSAGTIRAQDSPFVDQQVKVLVFSKTAGFRHDSIADGIAAIEALGRDAGFAVEATEDAGRFNDAGLAPYRAVVFLNTTGNILNSDQEAAFQRYIRGGGGYMGVHAAADSEYDWAWYGDLLGAYFANHPAIQEAQIQVADRVHPATAHLPARWQRRDEWYNYRVNPRGRVHVLATLDEGSYQGGEHGQDHPIAWCHDFDGGRSWYTGGGHTRDSYADPLFRRHLLGGIEYATGVTAADCGATLEANFDKVLLDTEAENPIDLAVAPDGRVFFIERKGVVKVYRPDLGLTRTVGQLAVSTRFEDGLLGLALDPDFARTNWIYLFYSPAGETAVQHIARFELEGDALVADSEEVLLQIPTQRRECCHAGGALVFGPEGYLYIGVGDNTNPFDSEGFSPIDERPGRRDWDAQRTAANSADLRGKILRIKPLAEGGYSIPPGNLFANGEGGRREIYTMGVRNPFRLSVDPRSGWLYWGDVGPDSRQADPQRGPAGLDEWNQARAAGNFGWPYCIGDNRPYVDYDFSNGLSGTLFNCGAPRNESPNNTGPVSLPPAQPAWVWYPYGTGGDFPQISARSGRTAMAGPVYQYDGGTTGPGQLPAYYDGTLFMYDWASNWIKEVKLDQDGQILKINPFLDGVEFIRPISMDVGPNGALYVLEWGSGFWGDNDDARLVRIDYVRGTRAPVARIEAGPTNGGVPLEVHFSGRASFDPDPGSALQYAWDFDGDDLVDATGIEAVFTYAERGDYSARLTVDDPQGNRAVAQVTITVGNSVPQVQIARPPDGGFFDWGEAIDFAIGAVDPEDGVADCERLVLQAFIGHDEHAHPLDESGSCNGNFRTVAGHGGDGDDLFYTLEARYTDSGAEGVAPLTGRQGYILQPKRKQAEHYTRHNGVVLEQTGDEAGGGQNIGFIAHGDWISFAPINLEGIEALNYRVASAGLGGWIEVRADAVDGPLLSRVEVGTTDGWQVYTDLPAPIEDPGGTHELFFVFLRNPGDDGLFNINWIDFRGPGISRLAQTAVAPGAESRAAEFALHPPYPNPFNAQAQIRFVLPRPMAVELAVFDILGQQVQSLASGRLAAGGHAVAFDGTDLASGIYILRLTSPAGMRLRRMVLLR
ncbi:MAG: carbohydrate-binding protein [Candidatus Latescibacteria bacterium]|nr:carbohydrate-binding protein [Candidatus Latescibacterota bacterium]